MILRDKAWLEHLKTEPCIFTGLRANHGESVVPAHIGTAGKGIKSPDNEVLPATDSMHKAMHQKGEIAVFRHAPGYVLRMAFKALAHEMYAEWKGLSLMPIEPTEEMGAEGFRYLDNWRGCWEAMARKYKESA